MNDWSKVIVHAEETARALSKSLVIPQPDSAYMRTNRTFRLEIDLTVVHADQSLGLEDGIIYKWLTVEAAAAAFTYRVRSPSGVWSDAFVGLAGAVLDNHDFIDISVSNAAGLGIAVIQVGWRE